MRLEGEGKEEGKEEEEGKGKGKGKEEKEEQDNREQEQEQEEDSDEDNDSNDDQRSNASQVSINIGYNPSQPGKVGEHCGLLGCQAILPDDKKIMEALKLFMKNLQEGTEYQKLQNGRLWSSIHSCHEALGKVGLMHSKAKDMTWPLEIDFKALPN